MEDAFAHPIGQVLGHFKVDSKAGLTDAQVLEQRNKHGKNGESRVAELCSWPCQHHGGLLFPLTAYSSADAIILRIHTDFVC